jgi:hypothetical protein
MMELVVALILHGGKYLQSALFYYVLIYMYLTGVFFSYCAVDAILTMASWSPRLVFCWSPSFFFHWWLMLVVIGLLGGAGVSVV